MNRDSVVLPGARGRPEASLNTQDLAAGSRVFGVVVILQSRYPPARLAVGGFFPCSQSRNPPTKALALSPARELAGILFSSLALPPPITTSSGSRAATRRATTSLTYRRHFFLPCFSSPRAPT